MKKMMLVLIVLAALLSACGATSDVSQNGIEISQATVLLPAGGAMGMAGMDSNASAFMQIKNTTAAADRLVGVACDFGEASLHETTMEGDVMKMAEIAGIDVPAGALVELKSGGYHIMVMNLNKDLKAGDSVNLTLEFEKAGKITLTLKLTSQ